MSENSKKIKVGLLGLGRISLNHLAALKELSNTYELSAVCDNDPRRLENTNFPEHAKKFTSLKNMLGNTNLDLISVCTPSGLHAKQSILAIENGINVVTEKPMATTLQDGLLMVNAAQKSNKKLFVVKQNRFNPTIKELKKAIIAKRFGKIFFVNVNVFWTRPQEYYDMAGWRGTWEFDGGALMNQASHYIDLMDWLIGPVEKVSTMTTTTRDIEVEDTATANVKWRNGALGSLNVTMLTYPKNLEGSILIIGEKGTAKVGGVALNKIEQWTFESNLDSDKGLLGLNNKIQNEYGNGHKNFYEHVAHGLRNESNEFIDAKEGLKSLELIAAMYKSNRDGNIVSLPLVNQ